jgi:hypothetical protein
MNYIWEKLTETGQYGDGFIDVYQSVFCKKAIVIINYLPQIDVKSQRVLLTLLLEGNKADWKPAISNNILKDVEMRVKNMENFKFNVFNSLEYMTVQTFYLNKLDNIDFSNFTNRQFCKK